MVKNINGINVFSAFNGIGCAAYVLDKLGIPVNKYYASEINPRANFIASKNFPKTIHFGDITKIRKEHFLSSIDFMCGGSPCQDLSFAGNMAGLEGTRSRLFYDFIRLWNELDKPLFFFENVRMTKVNQDKISQLFGCEPIPFDSALVSAQTRKRLYWTNLVKKEDFVYPEDRGIVLADILQFDSDSLLRWQNKKAGMVYEDKKAPTLRARLSGNSGRQSPQVIVKQVNPSKESGGKQPYMQNMVYDTDGKMVALTSMARSAKVTTNVNPSNNGINGNVYDTDFKAPTLTTNKGEGIKVTTHSSMPRNGKGKGGKGHLQKEDGKTYFIDTTCTTEVEYDDTYRKLTPIEVERCFSLPDNFTKGISNSARYHALGNGWECATIAEFFKYLK